MAKKQQPLSDEDQAESDLTRSRWAADHIKANPETKFTKEYHALAEKHLNPGSTDPV
jgi:hypothetical protein